MLDKKSIKVLKILNKHCNENSYIGKSELLLPFLPKFDLNTLDTVLWFLQSKGYVCCQSAEGTIFEILLTYEGKTYKEFEWINTKQFLFKSVLVPIIVSFVTTLAIGYINYFI